MWKKIFNKNDSDEITSNFEEILDDFDFGDEVVRPVGENVIKRQNTINEKEVESRAIAQMEAIKVSNAYEHIIGSFKATPRKDNEYYEAFKAERFERFKILSIVVADICDRHLGGRGYYQHHFNNYIFDEGASGKVISTLCDIIQHLVSNDNDECYDSYKSAFPDDIKFAIKALTVAIVDLSEGNI